jgi:hypothetical protein
MTEPQFILALYKTFCRQKWDKGIPLTHLQLFPPEHFNSWGSLVITQQYWTEII